MLVGGKGWKVIAGRICGGSFYGLYTRVGSMQRQKLQKFTKIVWVEDYRLARRAPPVLPEGL